MAFKVSIKKAVNADPKDIEKIKRVCSLWERVWNSAEFQKEILMFGFDQTECSGSLWWKRCSTKHVDGFRWNNGLSNAGVLDKLLSGAETLSPEKDSEADIELNITTNISSGVLGYTNPSTPMQWIAKWFFKESDEFDVLGNLSHEYCHKLGFDHEFRRAALRDQTVPYAVGFITEKLARKLS